jgi:hypothetical protein
MAPHEKGIHNNLELVHNQMTKGTHLKFWENFTWTRWKNKHSCYDTLKHGYLLCHLAQYPFWKAKNKCGKHFATSRIGHNAKMCLLWLDLWLGD